MNPSLWVLISYSVLEGSRQNSVILIWPFFSCPQIFLTFLTRYYQKYFMKQNRVENASSIHGFEPVWISYKCWNYYGPFVENWYLILSILKKIFSGSAPLLSSMISKEEGKEGTFLFNLLADLDMVGWQNRVSPV